METIPAARRRTDGASRSLRIIAESARMQVLVIRGHPMVPVTTIVQPAAFLVIFLGGESHASAAQRLSTVIGVLLTCLWTASLWASGGTLRREVADGTLARNLTGVSDPRLVIGGKCLGSTLLVLGLLLGTTAVTVVVTGIPFHLSGVPWLILGFIGVAASGTAMGFALCSIFVLTRHAIQVTAALSYPVLLLAGLLIPVSLIPAPLSWLTRLISLYWASQFLDRAADGAFAVAPALLLGGLTVTYFWAGSRLFARVIDLARRKGTIDLG